jgi:hypothetical protein
MIDESRLTAAESLVGWIGQQIEGLEVPSCTRNRIAFGCLHQVAEHHEAIALLVRHRLYGSAFSLVRPLFETYIRGVWLRHCASEGELSQFQEGKIKKTFAELIQDIESHEGYAAGVLSDVKRNSWDAMNDFTHGGSRQVARRNAADSIASNYTAGEVQEALNFSGAIGLLAAMEVILAAGRNDLVPALFEQMNAVGVSKGA